MCEVLLELMGDLFGSQPKGDQQGETSPRVTSSNDSEGGQAAVGVTRRQIAQDTTDGDRRGSHQCKLKCFLLCVKNVSRMKTLRAIPS